LLVNSRIVRSVTESCERDSSGNYLGKIFPPTHKLTNKSVNLRQQHWLLIPHICKLAFLKKQIHFVSSTSTKIWIGLILCCYLSFIVIVLEPFDTSQFEADYRLPLLAGYGILTGLAYVIHSCLENIWYFRLGKIWRVAHEVGATLMFCLFSGTVLYLYNRSVVNLVGYTWPTYARFLGSTVLSMIPVFVPLMLYLRNHFGERTEPFIPLANYSILLTGENKNERLELQREELLFVKAVENYVEICFMNPDKKIASKTFRQTLSNVCDQAPFLQKCHRSYLVNADTIVEIIGNSQSAKIKFTVGDKEIPLSKTYYKHIKNSVA